MNNACILSVEITNNKALRGKYSVIYHSPGASDCVFLDYFDQWCEKDVKKCE